MYNVKSIAPSFLIMTAELAAIECLGKSPFLIGSSSFLQVTRTRKNSLDEFEFDQIQPLTMDYAALRVSKHQCRSRFLGSKDMHRSLYVFDFGHIHTADIGVTWPWTVAVVFFNFRTIQNISMTLLAGFNVSEFCPFGLLL